MRDIPHDRRHQLLSLRRLLNIASIVCLVVCVSLMGMWVRSFWWADRLGVPLSPTYKVFVLSAWGQVRLAKADLCESQDPHWNLGGGATETVGNDFDGRYVPYWLLVIACGTLSLALQSTWPPRFTLRSLFIATTLLAIVLGMIACLDGAWIGK
jgi:hypothetical protein